MIQIRELNLDVEVDDDFLYWLRAISDIYCLDPYLDKTLLDYDQERLLECIQTAKRRLYDSVIAQKFNHANLPQDLEVREQIFQNFFSNHMRGDRNWELLCELEALLELALAEQYFMTYSSF